MMPAAGRGRSIDAVLHRRAPASDRTDPPTPSKAPMQVLLNADPRTDGSPEMADHVNGVVQDALARFGASVTRVDAHLSSAANRRHHGDPDEIACKLEARVVGLETVVVTEHAVNMHQAIQGATKKLQQAIASALARHDPVRGAVPLKALDLDGAEGGGG